MTSNNMLSAAFASERDVFIGMLNSIIVLDIGFIDNINDEGRAHVTTNRYINGERLAYQDVEVVYPGNPNGVFSANASGSACLIFVPSSCMVNIQKQTVRTDALPYHRDGIKAMPIGNGSSPVVNASFDTSGNLNIFTKDYMVSFTPNTISLQQDSVLQASKNIDGSLYFYYKPEQAGALEMTVDEQGIVQKYTSSAGDKTYTWVDSLSKDGTRSISKMDGNNAVFSISIGSDNSVTISTSGDLNLSGANVAITSTADNSTVSINGSNLVVEK